jgi:hypothetical protein
MLEPEKSVKEKTYGRYLSEKALRPAITRSANASATHPVELMRFEFLKLQICEHFVAGM